MTRFTKLLASTSIVGVLAGAGIGAQNPPQVVDPQAPQPVAIIGCVERAMPAQAADPTGTIPPISAQSKAPAYKLIDTQPGGGSPVTDPSGRVSVPPAKAPAVVEPQYWLAAPSTMELAKYQNQRVEVIGTLSPSTKAAAPPTGQSDVPTSTLTATSLRVVSTECK